MGELEEFIAKTKFYQTFDFGEGVIAKGGFDSPAEFEKLGLPISMKGMTYLDIGCNAGFFVMAAVRMRGAEHGVGIDKNKAQVEKATEFARLLGIRGVEFHHADIERRVFDGGADYVTLLSVFHHFEYPLMTMLRVARLVKKELIAEIWTCEEGPRAWNKVPMIVNRVGYYLPTKKATEEMLFKSGFRFVDEIGAGKTKDRILFRASM